MISRASSRLVRFLCTAALAACAVLGARAVPAQSTPDDSFDATVWELQTWNGEARYEAVSTIRVDRCERRVVTLPRPKWQTFRHATQSSQPHWKMTGGGCNFRTNEVVDQNGVHALVSFEMDPASLQIRGEGRPVLVAPDEDRRDSLVMSTVGYTVDERVDDGPNQCAMWISRGSGLLPAAATTGQIVPVNMRASGSHCKGATPHWRVDVNSGTVKRLIEDGSHSLVSFEMDPTPLVPSIPPSSSVWKVRLQALTPQGAVESGVGVVRCEGQQLEGRCDLVSGPLEARMPVAEEGARWWAISEEACSASVEAIVAKGKLVGFVMKRCPSAVNFDERIQVWERLLTGWRWRASLVAPAGCGPTTEPMSVLLDRSAHVEGSVDSHSLLPSRDHLHLRAGLDDDHWAVRAPRCVARPHEDVANRRHALVGIDLIDPQWVEGIEEVADSTSAPATGSSTKPTPFTLLADIYEEGPEAGGYRQLTYRGQHSLSCLTDVAGTTCDPPGGTIGATIQHGGAKWLAVPRDSSASWISSVAHEVGTSGTLDYFDMASFSSSGRAWADVKEAVTATDNPRPRLRIALPAGIPKAKISLPLDAVPSSPDHAGQASPPHWMAAPSTGKRFGAFSEPSHGLVSFEML